MLMMKMIPFLLKMCVHMCRVGGFTHFTGWDVWVVNYKWGWWFLPTGEHEKGDYGNYFMYT